MREWRKEDSDSWELNNFYVFLFIFIFISVTKIYFLFYFTTKSNYYI